MRYSAIADRLPGPMRRQVLHFESEIERAVAAFAQALPSQVPVLDAGAGECQYARYFGRQRYFAVDLGVGDTTWDYGRIDTVADLTSLPFGCGTFEAAVHIVTLEHVREPGCVVREIARTLAPHAPLLLIAPQEWEVHQAPHDFYRYTRYGLRYLLERAGMVDIQIVPVGGYFRLMARRLMNGLQFFAGGARWLAFIPAMLFLVPPALLMPLLDFLDRDRNFTLGYICTARKSA
ncbi:MAG: methyltransferase domain-containing protein [Bryobacteraceae bacterium]